MSLEVTVRHATLDDFPQMLPLFQILDSPDSPQPDSSRALSAWATLLAIKAATVFVAEIDGMLVSTCTLLVIPNITHCARPHALIENVATLESHRKQGFGRKVLHVAVDACWAAGCYKVVLSTGSKNASTLRFYEGAGFDKGTRTAFQMRRD